MHKQCYTETHTIKNRSIHRITTCRNIHLQNRHNPETAQITYIQALILQSTKTVEYKKANSKKTDENEINVIYFELHNIISSQRIRGKEKFKRQLT
jgi:hypothetical protein